MFRKSSTQFTKTCRRCRQSLFPENWPNLIPTDEDAEASSEGMRKVPSVSKDGRRKKSYPRQAVRFSNFFKLRRVTTFCIWYLWYLHERAPIRTTTISSLSTMEHSLHLLRRTINRWWGTPVSSSTTALFSRANRWQHHQLWVVCLGGRVAWAVLSFWL